MLLDEPLRRLAVRRERHAVGRSARISTVSTTARSMPFSRIVLERPFAARPRPVARLDPGARERLVIEHPEVTQAGDRAVDELGPVAGTRQPPAHLGDRPRSALQEARCRFQDDIRILDRGTPLAPLSEAFAPCSQPFLAVRRLGRKAAASTGTSAPCGA